MVGAHALDQHLQRFVEVEREDPVDQETGTVLHDHRRFAQLDRECVRGDQRLRGTAFAGDDLDERHAIDRVEEVQAYDTFGTHRACGDIGDR